MKTPAPLSPAARRLLELGSRVEPPTPEQSERLARALEPLLSPEPSPRPALSLRTGAPRLLSRARGALRIGSAQVVLGALAATASAAFWLGRVTTEPAAPAVPPESRPAPPAELPAGAEATVSGLAPSPTPPAPLAPDAPGGPRPAASGGALPAASAQAPARPSAPAQALRPPPASLASQPSPSDAPLPALAAPARSTRLSDEIEQLAHAEAVLRQGRAADALSYLDTLSIEHLLEQATALRVVAQCEAGLGSTESARELFERWPESPFGARVLGACATDHLRPPTADHPWRRATGGGAPADLRKGKGVPPPH